MAAVYLRKAGIPAQTLLPACCVTLDKSQSLSGPQLAHLWSGGWVVDDLLCSFPPLLLSV